MAKGSDNPFGSILVVESGTPASPPSGDQRVFIDSADHKVKRVNSSGTVTTIEAGSSGTVPIQDTLLTSTAASIVFSSIPGTYKHLLIYGQARCDDAASRQDLRVRFNADTAANYDDQLWVADNTSQSTVPEIGVTSIYCGDLNGAGAGTNMPSTHEILIPNYAATTFEKQLLARSFSKTSNAVSGVFLRASGGGWRSTVAITSVTVLPTAGLLIAGTRFSLYGWT